MLKRDKNTFLWKQKILHIYQQWQYFTICHVMLCKRGLCRRAVSVCLYVSLIRALNACGVSRNCDSEPTSLCCVLSTLRPARCYQHGAAGPWQVVTLIAGSMQQAAEFANSGRRRWNVMTRSVNVTPKTAEQHLIVRSDKSVAYVTNDKWLRSTFCTTEANYWQTQSIAWPLCDSRATSLH